MSNSLWRIHRVAITLIIFGIAIYVFFSFLLGWSAVFRQTISFLILGLLSPAFFISAIAPVVITNALQIASSEVSRLAEKETITENSTLEVIMRYEEGVAPYTIVEYALHYYSTWAASLALSGALITSAFYKPNTSKSSWSNINFDPNSDLDILLVLLGVIGLIITLILGFLNPFRSNKVLSSYDRQDGYKLFGVVLMPPWNSMTVIRTIILLCASLHIILIKMWHYDIVPLR